MRQVFHAQHQKDYDRGYEAKRREIEGLGWEAARERFNADCPHDQTFSSLADYYHSAGQLDALVDTEANRATRSNAA